MFVKIALFLLSVLLLVDCKRDNGVDDTSPESFLTFGARVIMGKRPFCSLLSWVKHSHVLFV